MRRFSALLFLLLWLVAGCDNGARKRALALKSLAQVAVVSPTTRDFPLTIKTPGMVLPLQEADLYSWVTGFVGGVPVDIGSRVREGEILATIHVPDLSNRFLKALAHFQLKLVVLDRYRKTILESPDIVSQGEVDQAKAQYLESLAELHQVGKILQLTVIRAPFSGTITRRYINTGDLAREAGGGNGRSTPLFRIESTDRVRVSVDLPQRYANIIHPGAPASIRLIDPPVSLAGKISLVSGSLNRISKTMPVQAIFDNPLHILKPGMFLSVGILLVTLHHVMTIPDQAIVTREGKPEVYLVSPDKTISIRRIVLGIDDGISAEVLSGLLPSDRIVVKGKHEIMPGDRVAIQDTRP